MNFLTALKELNGYWKWNGGRYLAKLTSGKVSDTFVNTGVLTCRPREMRLPCANLIYNLVHKASLPNQVLADFPWEDEYLREWVRRCNLHVCGPAMGGVTLAYEIAQQLGATAIFTEPKHDIMRGPTFSTPDRVIQRGQQLKRFEIPKGATVLFVEDVITTGKSTYEMVNAVCGDAVSFRLSGRSIVPYVLCLVNRSVSRSLTFTSELGTKTGMDIISLANIHPRTWDTVEEATEELLKDPNNRAKMEQYKVGNEIKLEAVRPKENWDLLMGDS